MNPDLLLALAASAAAGLVWLLGLLLERRDRARLVRERPDRGAWTPLSVLPAAPAYGGGDAASDEWSRIAAAVRTATPTSSPPRRKSPSRSAA